MKNKLFNILSFILIAASAYGQGNSELLEGKVTFITSQNIYVRFDDTKMISIGDTLQFSNGTALTSCLAVTQKSSTSCVCAIINNCIVVKDDVIYFQAAKEEEIKEEPETSIEELLALSLVQNSKSQDSVEEKPTYQQRIRGRISAATYSNISDAGDERHRMMYRFSMNASHINNSKFSTETYINYRQNFLQAGEVSNGQTKFFRIYNLALRYDIDSTLSLVVGRKINNKASSLGAIDGLQAEKRIGKNYIGLIAGFKPDIREFSFNSKLLEYGTYIGRSVSNNMLYAQSTIGLLEQRNAGNIDRRYVYFQHSSTINRKVNLFGSIEFDIYNKLIDGSNGSPRLTNLYLSARYKFNRKFSLGVSYDSRKRIVYYETYKTEIERLLADDQARQGLRFRMNVRPMKYVTIGAGYSKRFQNDNQNKSDNINGFVSLSRIPSVGGRVSLNFNMNTSNYLISRAYSLRHSRSLVNNKLNADFYFRLVNYKYSHSELNTNLSYYGTGLSYRITRKLRFSILGEMATRPSDNTYRFNVKIVKRFDKK